ncbi:FAD-dependent oxidoreductase [Brachybacterium sp. UNK5269]|uniref:FAD-dependent oxidoreductase n=1 Tax=Brachybacterium sp. UNK5269 TaxID=3408576 RepID=UPI003BB0FDCF
METSVRTADVVVIGAGQAGLSATFHLLRRGVRPLARARPGELSLLVLDAEDGPGGAWRHRWESLTMATVNGIRELPGMPEVEAAPAEPAREAVPAYFADFEDRFEVPIERPVRVVRVEDDPAAGPAPEQESLWPPLLVHSVGPDGTPRPPIRTRAVLNATGTWTRPFIPAYPGAADFRGRQLHTVDYTRAEDFAGQRVGIVGGGISALGFLQEIAEVGETFWYTRREPVLEDRPFSPERGRQAVAGVIDRVSRGLPVRSVVSATGLVWTPALREAQRRGVLQRRPMFERLTASGVIEADGSATELDAILWATGFRHELRHLRPLQLRTEHGGIRIDGTAAAQDPRIHLLGYGPSASTIGANRAGGAAVRTLLPLLDGSAAPRRAPVPA